MVTSSIQETLNRREHSISIARRQFFVHGKLPSKQIENHLTSSWRRCQALQLNESTVNSKVENYSPSKLEQASEESKLLLKNASGVLHQIYEQVRDSGCMVLLADNQGMILKSYGDDEFIPTAQKLALAPGAIWSESARGTNAVGTTIIERKPLEVWSGEHYIQAHKILTCSGAPIMSHAGELLGVIDISGDRLAYHPYSLALVRLAAQNIERRIFISQHQQHFIFAFHHDYEVLGANHEGLLAFDSEGTLRAINPIGQKLMGLSAEIFRKHPWAYFSDLPFGNFMDRVHLNVDGIHVITSTTGDDWYFQFRGARAPANSMPSAKTSSMSEATILPNSRYLKPDSANNSKKLDDLEKAIIQKTVDDMDGNVSAAAKKLGISRNKLYRKISL